MASVGEQLKSAREKQGLSIPQIAERTKLRSDHVRALEAGNYDVFAAPVYVRGFIRSYAKLVKINPDGLLTDLEAELGQSQRLQDSTQLMKPTPTALDVLMLRPLQGEMGRHFDRHRGGAADLLVHPGLQGVAHSSVHRSPGATRAGTISVRGYQFGRSAPANSPCPLTGGQPPST